MKADLRQAFRSFVRNPWFTLVSITTLALGIGVNSALFTVVKSVLLEDLPYGKPDQLIRVWVVNPQQGFDRDVTSYPRFEDWKTRSKTIADFAGFTGSRMILTGRDEPVQLRGAQVTANFFRVMGVHPILFRTILTVGEIGLAMVLLTGAVLLIRSFQHLQDVPLGFEARNVFVAPIQLPQAKYPGDRQAATFYESLVARLNNTAGIESAGAISTLLLGTLPDSNIFTIEGRPQTIFTPLTIDVATPEIFSVMKIPLLKGRFFDSRDRADSLPVAIINAATAKRYWEDRDPVGQRFTFGRPGPDTRWYTIVGVVADTRRAGVDHPVFTESYSPMAQQPERMLQVVVRSNLNASDVRKTLAAAVRELDRDQPLASFGTLENGLNQRTASRRFVVFLLSLFAATAATIAGVGIYGLMAYLVAQRRRELGVRVALGAKPTDVLGLVLGNVMAIAGSGLALGGICAWGFSRVLEGLLFGIGPLDPASYLAAAVGVLIISVASAIVPTIVALRMDPVTALRHN